MQGHITVSVTIGTFTALATQTLDKMQAMANFLG